MGTTLSRSRPVRAEELMRISGHYELIEGELREMSPAGGQHGRVSMALSSFVGVHVEDNGLGHCYSAETGFLLATNPDTVLAPDMAFIRASRLPLPEPAGFIPVIPDLVLETRSPGDSRAAVAAKVRRWLGYGVQVVWTVDPAERSLSIHRPGAPAVTLSAADVLTEPDLLPGFALPLARVLR